MPKEYRLSQQRASKQIFKGGLTLQIETYNYTCNKMWVFLCHFYFYPMQLVWSLTSSCHHHTKAGHYNGHYNVRNPLSDHTLLLVVCPSFVRCSEFLLPMKWKQTKAVPLNHRVPPKIFTYVFVFSGPVKRLHSYEICTHKWISQLVHVPHKVETTFLIYQMHNKSVGNDIYLIYIKVRMV